MRAGMNKNAPEQNREKKRPVRYLLISVCERDIVTEFLGTYQEAFSQMLSELKEEFCKGNDPDDWEAYAHLPHYSSDTFCFAEKSAWSNLDHNWNYDWLIVEIPETL